MSVPGTVGGGPSNRRRPSRWKHWWLHFGLHTGAVWAIVLVYDVIVEEDSRDPLILLALLTGGLALSALLGAYLAGMHDYDRDEP